MVQRDAQRCLDGAGGLNEELDPPGKEDIALLLTR